MQQIRPFELDPRRRQKLGVLHPLFAFFIPVIVFLFAYAGVRIFPFGEKQILTVDLFHQYAPFLQELRHKLTSGESLLFSWSGGLGVNFYPLFAYYLASPFNLILLLFPASFLAEGILFISVLKIGLCGFTAYFFLRKGKALAKTTALIFALPYALSAFIVAYSWNIMWLDVILLLPLLAYTAILIIQEGKIVPYIIVLSLSIIFNYYIAFFACIFIALYFPVLLIEFLPEKGWQRPKDYLQKLGLFAASSLLSGFLSFFIIWPTYLSLKITSAAGDQFPKPWDFKHSFLDLIPRLFFGSKPNIRHGLPNIYLGVIVLLLVPLFFLSKRIPKRNKFAYGALVGIIALSFNVNALDFIWHGFHYPNQIPYRYAFVFVFLLMVMAAEAWEAFSWTRDGAAIKVFLGLVLLISCMRSFGAFEIAFWPLIISFALLLIYLAILLSSWRHAGRKEVLSALLFMFICFELGLSTFLGISEISKNEYYGLRDGFSYGSGPQEIRAAVKELQAKHPGSLVRTEIRPKKSVNDPMLYSLNGFSIFSSSFSHEPIKLMGKLGYPVNGVNSFEFSDSTIPMNDLIGLNYIINRDVESKLRSAAVPSFAGDEIMVHENHGAFPFAFSCPKTVSEFEAGSESPFINQSDLFQALFSTNQLFEPVKLKVQQVQSPDSKADEQSAATLNEASYYLSDYEDGGQVLKLNSATDYTEANLELEAEADGYYYLYYKSSQLQVKNCYFTESDDQYAEYQLASSRRNDMLDLGQVSKGQKIKIRFTFGGDLDSGSIMIFPVRFIAENYEPVRAKIEANNFEWLKFSANKLEFKLTAKEDSYAFLSTCYEPGWQIEVDGKRVQPTALDSCFLLVPITSGQQIISLKFVPAGLSQAALVSLAALILLIVIAVLEFLSEKRKRAAEDYYYPELDYADEAADEAIAYADSYLDDLAEMAELEAQEEASSDFDLSDEDNGLAPKLNPRQELLESIAAAEGGGQNLEDFINSERIQAITIKRRRKND
ncbi:MAG: YfhO family protein [Eubacteriales bacterium]|nr:YfhO family protein [Eubacteriales bacterium]